MARPTRELDAVLEYLSGLGATAEQLAAAAADERPSRVALDVVLTKPMVLSARQLAERLGVTVERVVEMVNSMGFTVDDVDGARFTEADVELLEMTDELGIDLAHVLASSFNRIADAVVTAYIDHVDPRLASGGVTSEADGALRNAFENFLIRIGYPAGPRDELQLAEAHAQAGQLALRAADSLGSFFIHALREAVRWQRVAQASASEPALTRLAVGFVDLVGFTSMSRQMTVGELTHLVLAFESTAFRIATSEGGRVVKHVGDEVMFVALDAPTAMRVAGRIITAFCDRGICPRGGVAYGDVLAVHGDYYGSVVNLASRLTDEAIPGEVLTDAAAVEAAGDRVGRFEPAGRRMLKGFDEPVTVHTFVWDPNATGEVQITAGGSVVLRE